MGEEENESSTQQQQPPQQPPQQEQLPEQQQQSEPDEEIVEKEANFIPTPALIDEAVSVTTAQEEHIYIPPTPSERPVPFPNENKRGVADDPSSVNGVTEISAIEEQLSSLKMEDDEKAGESSHPGHVVEAEPSSPNKNTVFTFALDGEEAIESPVSCFTMLKLQKVFYRARHFEIVLTITSDH